MEGLNQLSPYCLHFCKSVGVIQCDVDPSVKKNENPFLKNEKYQIKKDVLLCEYIDKSCKFYNFIRAVEKIPEDILYSTIKQILMAVTISQAKKQFSHYDLHSFNIMMKKCNKDAVFLYVVDEENQYLVPTLGYYPIIIDFGFSYNSNMDDNSSYGSMGFTDIGFTSDRFDWVSDPKLFLVSVSYEIKEKRNTKKAKKLRNVVKNIFYPLKIDWECGWDKNKEKSASSEVLEMLEDFNEDSVIFTKYNEYCLDILQSLIILPFEEQKYKNINAEYNIFLKEWVKIENEISSPYYNLYILKEIVDVARELRAHYMIKNKRDIVVKFFTDTIHEKISKVAKFCNPKKINYERLLCSMYVFSRSMEGVLYDITTSRMAEKQHSYNKMKLKSVEQIYGAVEANIPCNYIYSEKTTIFIMDSLTEKSSMCTLTPELVNQINKLHPIQRGKFLYKNLE